MERAYDLLKQDLLRSPRSWLITGVAGFIGSHLLEELLRLKQKVVGFDNFSTGHRKNLENVRNIVGEEAWSHFSFLEADLTEPSSWNEKLKELISSDTLILHQGALGSVPRSIQDPLRSHEVNATGTLHLLEFARINALKRFVYASSSSVYGDSPTLPKIEHEIGSPLSPYAVTKFVDELYAGVYQKNYGLETLGLRYFNIFGPRQDPEGPYAAVIPRWIEAILKNDSVHIYGDGKTSRDFTYVQNAVEANILAACTQNAQAYGEAFNIACGSQLSLKELFESIKNELGIAGLEARFDDFRQGDVRHSLANLEKASNLLGYRPSYGVQDGLKKTLAWYQER